MLTKSFEIKNIELKQSESNNFKFSGYASTFGNIDYHSDVIEKGAFKRSISKNVPVLYNHKKQIGWATKMKEDSKGLYVEAEILSDPDLQTSKEAVVFIKSAIEKGFSMGLSIGGVPLEYKRLSKGNKSYFLISDFELLEFSVTPTPANPQAQITDMKSFLNSDKEVINDRIELINHMSKHFLFKHLYYDLLTKMNNK